MGNLRFIARISAANSLVAAFLLACTPGCTLVQVDGPARIVRVYPGLLTIQPLEAGVVAYRTTGFGLVPTYRGVTLGVATETALAIGDLSACRLVMFQPDRADVAALARSLSSVIGDDAVCSTGGIP